ncbi:MAG: ABC transporter permease subunit [Verrucomicrobiae bacterium]|nr:ABC transporter permease subunit [Verrucomicrobiae bacterium]
MLRFIGRRLLETIPLLLAIATFTFFMIRLAPGGPFSAERNVTPEILLNLERHYGFDQPLWKQYLDYLGGLLRGDLGPSFKYQTHTVNELIADAFPVSLELGAWALLVALSVGLGTGLLAALKRNTALDHGPMSIATLGICLPTFVMGPLLVLLFALGLGWFNAWGWYEPRDRVLPALTLGLYYAAYVARLTRGGMLEVLSQDFIRTARAKGASESRVLLRHALRGGLLPVVAFLGPAAAGLITGSFVVETIFGVPGLGQFFVKSALNRDYTMVLGTVLLYATLIIALNLVVDILQAWLNPKLRLE